MGLQVAKSCRRGRCDLGRDGRAPLTESPEALRETMAEIVTARDQEDVLSGLARSRSWGGLRRHDTSFQMLVGQSNLEIDDITPNAT